MNWFNYYGLIFVAVILIPNVIFAIKCKDGFENKWKNKAVETAEQIGRFGSFIFMIFNIPKTYFGFWFDGGFIAYIVVESLLYDGGSRARPRNAKGRRRSRKAHNSRQQRVVRRKRDGACGRRNR